jgi:hypothetical protein
MTVLSRLPAGVRPRKCAASFAATVLALCFAVREGMAQPPDTGATSTVQGTVRRSTTAPMGEIDGAVLDKGTVTDWPPHYPHRPWKGQSSASPERRWARSTGPSSTMGQRSTGHLIWLTDSPLSSLAVIASRPLAGSKLVLQVTHTLKFNPWQIYAPIAQLEPTD